MITKEMAKERPLALTFFLFYGLVNSSGFYQHMSLIEEGSINYFKQKFVTLLFPVLEALSHGSSVQ